MAEHPALAVSEEPLARVRGEAEVLVRAHWREVALHRDRVPLDIDWSLYDLMARAGQYRVWTAREAGRLVGYIAFFVRASHPHYKRTAWAQNDVFYVEPGARAAGIGRALIEAALAALKPAAGHAKVTLHAKTAHDFPDLAAACGFAQTEVIYERLIG
jgi:GNAT superfamily N-acetyltransferase